MTRETIKIERDLRGVAAITLARPDKHNAMNLAMIQELTAAARSLGADPSVRVVVLTGEGKSFCAGGDLDWMREQSSQDRQARLAQATQLAAMLHALDVLPKPLIGRVHGSAFGGGVGLMTVCDVVVSVDTAKFSLTETRLGMIPATIGPFVVRCLGERAARRFMLNATMIDASTALATGLVSLVTPMNRLDEAVESEIAAFLACAPGAIAATKALCQQLARNPGHDQQAWTAEQLADRWETDEAKEGLKCFFERCEPSWRRKV